LVQRRDVIAVALPLPGEDETECSPESDHDRHAEPSPAADDCDRRHGSPPGRGFGTPLLLM